MPTAITTSTAATATAYSNQRKIDRTSNGVLWMFYVASGTASVNICYPHYSLDNGATWNFDAAVLNNGSGSNTATYVRNLSVFIDQDDYAHVVFKDNSDGFIYYRRGTPNAGRTAWTWSAATDLSGGGLTTCDFPDVIAHREGTGWVAHVVYTYTGSSTLKAAYNKVTITSGGAISATARSNISATVGASSNPGYPSIDFNHTGDGKTVAGGTPHLYVGWSAGFTGAGLGIRFRKATYSAGTWTWGTEVEIDSTRYVQNDTRWINCMFDGTRVALSMFAVSTVFDLVLYERDAADTATVTRVLLANVALGDQMFYGSSSYDSAGNVYFFGRNGDEAAGTHDLVYRKWTRSGASLGAEVVIDSGVGNPYVSAKRGYSNNRLDFIYTDGTASPYTVTYDAIILPALTPYVPMIML